MSAGSGRIPLWVVATIAGLGVITVVGIFFYGAYAGVGSSM
ncbi:MULTISPECIES: photosystem II reaction center protein J [Nostocales]|nr:MULTISPECIES: photosystem II reaction center protein J [Nodularia]MDB9375632.1 photosystem II reaction center protein J [Nodularia sphaerocarpa CS-585]MDB9376530.1 photosystem II reaction center protein J [Nodularia sphaerocarpa CS-585A2]MDP5337376.1 photosystem II reaction center protein J [Nodularia sp. (in: cyanobacteria)]HYW17948.1 photosystem II reaction center protein J [Nodularia sp. (in: cyanobacteria)]